MAKWRSYGKRITFPVRKRANGITDPSIDFLLNEVVDMKESRYCIKGESEVGKRGVENRIGKKERKEDGSRRERRVN